MYKVKSLRKGFCFCFIICCFILIYESEWNIVYHNNYRILISSSWNSSPSASQPRMWSNWVHQCQLCEGEFHVAEFVAKLDGFYYKILINALTTKGRISRFQTRNCLGFKQKITRHQKRIEWEWLFTEQRYWLKQPHWQQKNWVPRSVNVNSLRPGDVYVYDIQLDHSSDNF